MKNLTSKTKSGKGGVGTKKSTKDIALSFKDIADILSAKFDVEIDGVVVTGPAKVEEEDLDELARIVKLAQEIHTNAEMEAADDIEVDDDDDATEFDDDDDEDADDEDEEDYDEDGEDS